MTARTKSRMSTFVDVFFKDKSGKWAIVQTPNIPLIIWLLLAACVYAIENGQLKQSISLLRDAVLFTWSYLEITQGLSIFRRLLGTGVLLAIVITFF